MKIGTHIVLAVMALAFMSAGKLHAQEVVEEGYVIEQTEAPAQYTLMGAEKNLIASRIASWNKEWKKVELSGSISIDGLPVKPSLKIFMESGKKIFISIRAPFLGEVARIEMTPEDVIGINKIKQTYYNADPRSVLEADPTIISELQAVLLGRIAIPGCGEFKASDVDKVEIMQDDANSFLVIPAEVVADGILNFGYSVATTGRLQEFIGMYSAFNGYLDLNYFYSGDKMQIKAELVGGKSKQSVTIQLDPPIWDTDGFGRLKIPSGYRRVGFRELLKFN